MNARKVAGLFTDWVKGGYRFGYTFSNMVSEKLEMSPKVARAGGTVFDVAAGAGLVVYAATGALSITLGAAAAAAAVTTAPVAALVTVSVGAIFLAMDCVIGGIGLGLLDAARVKCGLPKPEKLIRTTQGVITHSTDAVKNIFQSGAAKLSSAFKSVSGKTKPAKKPVHKPSPGISFKL